MDKINMVDFAARALGFTTPAPQPPHAETAVEVANAAIRVLRNFQRDVRSGALIAAEAERKQAVELVSRVLADAWFAAYEEAHGPAPICSWCGMIESIDCKCPIDHGDDADDVPFA